MTPSSGATDPVKRPTVKLGDAEYEVKFRLCDLAHLAKQHNIDLASSERVEVKGFAALERLAIIVSAGIAHAVTMTPEQVMEHIDATEVALYSLAVIEAQKKVSAEAQAAQKKLEAMVPKPPKATAADKTVQ
jgi:hypothetical protein